MKVGPQSSAHAYPNQICWRLQEQGNWLTLRSSRLQRECLVLRGRLSGVMDDRGKYTHISLEEMKAVAGYIKREGRGQHRTFSKQVQPVYRFGACPVCGGNQ